MWIINVRQGESLEKEQPITGAQVVPQFPAKSLSI
jgi:hypothetical protein